MEFVLDSIFVRTMGEDGHGLKPGEVIDGHTHLFDHTSIFFCGNWHIKKWTPEGKLAYDFEREGPFFVLIEADSKHEFTFLGGAPIGYAYCVFSHRESTGEVSHKYTGWLPAYAAKG